MFIIQNQNAEYGKCSVFRIVSILLRENHSTGTIQPNGSAIVPHWIPVMVS